MGINWISLSDLHFGAPRIPPGVIFSNIKKCLFPLLNDELNLLTIVGDVSDGLLEFGGQPSFETLQFIDDLIDLSIKHDFYIRILRGTFTHDRRQSKFFDFRSNKTPTLKGSPRVRYFDSIDIERIESLDINLLYKPDSLPYKNVFSVLRDLVKEVGLDIDIFLNHGYFEHLLPKGIPHRVPQTLVAEEVESIVKGVVVNGHIHTPSVYRKVINHGSFDRLNHGEEEPKGFFKLAYDPISKKCNHQFIENTYATLFKTIYCSGMENNLEQCKKYVTCQIEAILNSNISTSSKVFIRIACEEPLVRVSVVEYLKTKYPDLVVDGLDTRRNKKVESSISKLRDAVEELPSLTPENLAQMVVEYTNDKGTPLPLEYIKDQLTV